jgi:hypothetical protein
MVVSKTPAKFRRHLIVASEGGFVLHSFDKKGRPLLLEGPAASVGSTMVKSELVLREVMQSLGLAEGRDLWTIRGTQGGKVFVRFATLSPRPDLTLAPPGGEGRVRGQSEVDPVETFRKRLEEGFAGQGVRIPLYRNGPWVHWGAVQKDEGLAKLIEQFKKRGLAIGEKGKGRLFLASELGSQGSDRKAVEAFPEMRVASMGNTPASELPKGAVVAPIKGPKAAGFVLSSIAKGFDAVGVPMAGKKLVFAVLGLAAATVLFGFVIPAHALVPLYSKLGWGWPLAGAVLFSVGYSLALKMRSSPKNKGRLDSLQMLTYSNLSAIPFAGLFWWWTASSFGFSWSLIPAASIGVIVAYARFYYAEALNQNFSKTAMVYYSMTPAIVLGLTIVFLGEWQLLAAGDAKGVSSRPCS